MMTFRDYRAKGTVRAAEITEESIELIPAEAPYEKVVATFGKGDYVENRSGKLIGWTKVDFEAAYGPTRQRQSRAKKTRKKAAAAGGGNGEQKPD
jgi:hypothetical protein